MHNGANCKSHEKSRKIPGRMPQDQPNASYCKKQNHVYSRTKLDVSLSSAFCGWFWDFPVTQLRVSPLRKLTFGVLVIALGCLAALPFRRYQSIPDASTLPVEATGPTQSALNGTNLEMLVNDKPHVIENLQSLALRPRPVQSLPSDHNRSLAIPKSYSQVAVPLDQVAANEDDFNATTPVRAKIERKRLSLQKKNATKTQPLAIKKHTRKSRNGKATERIAKQKPNEDKKTFGAAFGRTQSAPSLAKSETPPKSRYPKPETNAKLASTSSTDSVAADSDAIERLPAANENDGRKRHWIRQP